MAEVKYSKAIERLDEIIGKIESDDIDVDELSLKVKEAVAVSTGTDADILALAVLHDLALAAHFFPRLVVLDGGRVVADGPPAQVLTRERVRATFGVDLAMLTGPAAFDGAGSELTAGTTGR